MSTEPAQLSTDGVENAGEQFLTFVLAEEGLRALKRRSQKAYLSWKAFERQTTRFFPPIRLLHPHPAGRFDARPRRRSPVR